MAGIPSPVEKCFGIELECVATGLRHDQRAVARIIIVNQSEKVILNCTVKVQSKIFSYLTPLTGLKEGDLDRGIPFEDAVCEVKKVLGPEVILIGQGIDYNIQLLHLIQGVSYQKYVHLGEMFKSNRPPYGRVTYFTLRHEANVLLQQGKLESNNYYLSVQRFPVAIYIYI